MFDINFKNSAIFLIAVLIIILGLYSIHRYVDYKERQSSLLSPLVLVSYENIRGHSSAFHIGDGYFLSTMHNLQNGLNAQLTDIQGNIYETIVLWESQRYDLSLLRSTTPVDNLNSFHLNCSSTLQIGEPISLMGHPYGLRHITTHARVAGIRTIYNYRDVIPISGTLIPGMSGGPVLDQYNTVVGINSSYLGIQGNPTGISFIIPSNPIICNMLTR